MLNTVTLSLDTDADAVLDKTRCYDVMAAGFATVPVAFAGDCRRRRRSSKRSTAARASGRSAACCGRRLLWRTATNNGTRRQLLQQPTHFRWSTTRAPASCSTSRQPLPTSSSMLHQQALGQGPPKPQHCSWASVKLAPCMLHTATLREPCGLGGGSRAGEGRGRPRSRTRRCQGARS